MTKGFWSALSLFAVSAVAVPMAFDGQESSVSTTTSSLETTSSTANTSRCGRLTTTVYVTETPAVVTLDIQIVSPVSQQATCTFSTESAPVTSETVKAPEVETPPAPAPEAPQEPEAPKVDTPAPAPEAPETPKEPEAPEVDTPAPAPEAPKVDTPAPAPEAAKVDTPPAPAHTESASDNIAPVTPPSDGGNSGPITGAAGVVHKGRATYYSPEGAAGACGEYNSDSDKVVALPFELYDELKNSKQSRCGSGIRVTYNGKTVEGKVADRCPGCGLDESFRGESELSHLDLSEGFFAALADPSEGFIQPIYWEFV